MASLNIPESNLPRVVIVGGGFGGINLLKKLVKTRKFQVILIDKRNYHTFQPLLYQVSTYGLDTGEIAYPLRKTVKKNTPEAYFRLAEVNSTDTKQQIIHTNIGEINYDYLVLATGSKTNFFGNAEIEKYALRMKTAPQALNIRTLILENLEEATITKDKKKRAALLNFVIAGAGPTGVELSGAISEIRKNVVPRDYIDISPSEIHIHLLEGQDEVLPPMSDKASKNAKKSLEKLGVELHLGTMVKSYNGHTVKTGDGQVFETETFIWTAGVNGSPVEGIEAPALVERPQRYQVNVFNQIEGYENIFAIGDIALMQSEAYPKGHPMMAQPAIQQGKHLAKNLVNMVTKSNLEPFKYFDKGSMATIGRNKAVVDIKNFHFSGIFAWFVWMFIHLYFLIGFRNRVLTLFTWMYRYINFDRGSRLIIRPFKQNRAKLEDED